MERVASESTGIGGGGSPRCKANQRVRPLVERVDASGPENRTETPNIPTAVGSTYGTDAGIDCDRKRLDPAPSRSRVPLRGTQVPTYLGFIPQSGKIGAVPNGERDLSVRTGIDLDDHQTIP